MNADSGELLRRYLTSIPDTERLRDLLHPDVSFTLYAPSGRTNTGRDRILRGLEREFVEFYNRDSFSLNVIDSFGCGDNAAARFVISAETQRGPYENHYAILARFRDGLLIEAWEYVDSASARNQLGAPKLSS
ncbi:nuclear transport factor 2 family protein [Mycobacterium sp. 2YAF39]|uniref:nuclear transport factor 2 family protein n=1 Tax=Mycobacterium sp. 2YAF39 TaxID=3233033 RepID=UPI003F94558F